MPLLNQDLICEVVASHKYTSVIDMTDAYEQMRVMPEDVPKTIFASPLGTFVSNVLQQGDCNGPSSWQRLMTYVFRDRISVEVWVYIDNIFIFSNMIARHKEVLQYVLEQLTKEHLYRNSIHTQYGLTASVTFVTNLDCMLQQTNWS